MDDNHETQLPSDELPPLGPGQPRICREIGGKQVRSLYISYTVQRRRSGIRRRDIPVSHVLSDGRVNGRVERFERGKRQGSQALAADDCPLKRRCDGQG